MPNLSIKNVPDELLRKLRERAAAHHRSLQGELMALLVAAAGAAPPGAAEPPPSGEGFRARRSGTRRIEQIAAEHRERWSKPLEQGPRAVDVIRAERDAR